jgi:hypothetical protein
MTTLGYSYWGFCEEHKDSSIVESPDGGRLTRPIFVKELFKRDIEVICLQQKREAIPLQGLQYSTGFPKLDVLFIEFRWSTYKNDTSHRQFKKKYYEPDLDRQTEILNHYVGRIPIVIWDTDLKIEKHKFWKYGKNVILTEPSFFCKNKEAISMPYFTDYDLQLFNCITPKKQIVYIGSNYERYWAVEKYFYEHGKTLNDNGILIEFYGNWLNFSPERPEQEAKVKQYSEFITFHKRNKFLDGMKILNESICTAHITKQEYCKYGLITPRYFESLASGCIAFIPEEFPIQLYGDKFVANDNFVEKINWLTNISLDERIAIIEEQKANAQIIAPQTKVSSFVDNLLRLLA